MTTLRLYYPLDEGKGPVVYENSDKWDNLKSSYLASFLTPQKGIYWERLSPLNICPAEFLYNNGECDSENAGLYFDSNTCSVDAVATINSFETQAFTIDMWMYISSDIYYYPWKWKCTSRDIYAYYEPSGDLMTFHFGETYTQPSYPRNVWVFMRFTIRDDTYQASLTQYYPRANKQKSGPFAVTSNYPNEIHNAPISFFTSTPTVMISRISIWKSWLGEPHVDTIPMNAFYHPDYADTTLYAYYPFRYNFNDESGNQNHMNYPATLLTCDFKYHGGNYNVFEFISQDNEEITWSSGKMNRGFTQSSANRDGCILRYTFGKHLMFRTHNYRINSCSEVVNSGHLALLGTDPSCYTTDTEVIIGISSDHQLSNGQQIDLIASIFVMTTGSNLRHTHSASLLFPTFTVNQGNSIAMNADNSQVISIAISDEGTLTRNMSWVMSSGPEMIPIDNDYTTESYTFVERSFKESGTYSIRITMSFTEHITYNYMQDITLTVSKTPIPSLTGGDKVYKIGNSVTLSASQSIDQDTGTTSNLLTYVWECSKKEDFSSSCSSPITRELRGNQRNLATILTETSHTYTFSTTGLTKGDYYFRVTVTKNGFSARKETKVTLVDSSTEPIISISYTSLPLPPDSSGTISLDKLSSTVENTFTVDVEDVDFKANTSKYLEYGFAWKITPAIKGEMWVVQNRLKIKKYLFEENTEYEINATATVLSSNSTNSITKKVTMSRIPTIGSGVVTPTIGEAYSTKFNISVSGCVDPESTFLTYRFGYRMIGGSGLNMTDWGGDSAHNLFTLGAGNARYNYLVEVYGEVANKYGSIGIYSQNVTIKHPATAQTQQYVKDVLTAQITPSLGYEGQACVIQGLTELVLNTNAQDWERGTDLCGGCDSRHGSCNTSEGNNTCTCMEGYKGIWDCSIGDAEGSNVKGIEKELSTAIKQIVIGSSTAITSSVTEITLSAISVLANAQYAQDKTSNDELEYVFGSLVASLQGKLENIRGGVVDTEELFSEEGVENGFRTAEGLLMGIEYSYRGKSLEYWDCEEKGSLLLQDIMKFGVISKENDRLGGTTGERVVNSNFILWKAAQEKGVYIGGTTINQGHNSLLLPLNFATYLPNDTDTSGNSVSSTATITYQTLSYKKFNPHSQIIGTGKAGVSNSSDVLGNSVNFGLYLQSGRELPVHNLNSTDNITLQLEVDTDEGLNLTGYDTYCVYYDRSFMRYSTEGVKTKDCQIIKGKGTCQCEANHLSEFTLIRNKTITTTLLNETQTNTTSIYIYIYYE